MKRSGLVACAVLLFAGGFALHAVLAASPAVMDEPLTVTKGMWAGLVCGVLSGPNMTASFEYRYAYDPATNTVTGTAPAAGAASARDTIGAKMSSTLSQIQRLLEPVFPGVQVRAVRTETR